MLLLEHVDSFEVAKETLVIPRVARVMNLFVSPFIGQEYFSGVSPDVGKRIKDVSGVASRSLALYRR